MNRHNFMFCTVAKIKSNFLTAFIALFICSGLSFASDKSTIIAEVNGISIDRVWLASVEAEYKKRTKKQEVTEEERLKLLNNIIRGRLILQDESVPALRNDPETIKMVKQFEDSIIIKKFLQLKVGKKLKVDDSEIKDYYNKNRSDFKVPSKVRARHILLRTEKEAERVFEKLKNGADFIQLAKDYSIDLPFALEGGKMGIITKGNNKNCLPELQKELFILNAGEHSDIVKTIYGYHILRVDEIIPPQYKPLDTVSRGIRQAILRQKERIAYGKMVKQLEEKADIKIYKKRLSSQGTTPLE